jgi:hypothetical protein
MDTNEIMEAISEALTNLKDEYPLDKKSKANQAFGHLMSRFDWHPKTVAGLQDDGTIRMTFEYIGGD